MFNRHVVGWSAAAALASIYAGITLVRFDEELREDESARRELMVESQLTERYGYPISAEESLIEGDKRAVASFTGSDGRDCKASYDINQNDYRFIDLETLEVVCN